MSAKVILLLAVTFVYFGAPDTLMAAVLAAPSGLSASAACTRLVEAYAECSAGLSYDPKSHLVSISPYTGRVPCSDGKTLPFYERLEKMDFASQLVISYLPGKVTLPNPHLNDDGGRLRFDPLFKEIYGRNANEVRQNLVKVRFLNQSVPFNRKNGAASALAAVGVELMKAMKTDAQLAQHLQPWLKRKINLALMTFNWRKVAPTDRLSNHSFGAAIDLNDLQADGPVYWLWDLASQRQKELQRKTGKKRPLSEILKTIKESETDDFKPLRIATTPAKLIEIFEKNGFIWGGKWFHFDSMHFEYRPEFYPDLHPSCAAPLVDAVVDAAVDAEDEDFVQVTGEDETSEMTQLLQDYHWD